MWLQSGQAFLLSLFLSRSRDWHQGENSTQGVLFLFPAFSQQLGILFSEGGDLLSDHFW